MGTRSATIARRGPAAFALLLLTTTGATTTLPACDACDSAKANIRFYPGDYQGWLWEESGGTLAFGGVVPATRAEASGMNAGAPCPSPSEAIAYQRANYPDAPERTFRNIQRGGGGPPPSGNECVYEYEDDYCSRR